MFGLQDNYAAIAIGGIAGSVTLPDSASPAAEAVEAALDTEAARQANARAKGASVRMVVAVTERAIHVFSTPALGGAPQRELHSFDRATTEVEVKRFGLSRRLKLFDRVSGHEIGLTGSTAPFSRVAGGDKAVLAELADGGR